MTKKIVSNQGRGSLSGEGRLDFPEIPPDLIAQTPLRRRDAARLMVLERKSGVLRHETFSGLDRFLEPGDVLVLNDARVFPARLTGRKRTGGRVRILLIKRWAGDPSDGPADRWLALLTPALRPGADVLLEGGLSARVEARLDSGEYLLAFSRDIAADLDRLGRMPLPPYIRRGEGTAPEMEALDREYYQTVYARSAAVSQGAVAAPTAGLHFTTELLDRVRAKGAEVVFLRLDVGWGTFRPVAEADYRKHRMLPEAYEVPAATAEALNRARQRGGRVWAVGTTVTRTLETVVGPDGLFRPGAGETDKYIYPGHGFRAVDALVTNFHLPGHTPLLLAAAFAGEAPLRRAYEEAVREKYRFFSYGDAMAIL